MPHTHAEAPCLHQLLAAHATHRPRARAAVELGGPALTWGALAARVDALADRLLRLGVGPEVPVGVCLDRSLDLVVALLAVHQAGGVFVPLDPNLPDRRLDWLVADAGIEVLLEHRATRGRVGAATTVRVDLPQGPSG